MPKKVILDKEILQNLYIEQNLSQGEIAEILNCSIKVVYTNLKYFSIKKSSELVEQNKKKKYLKKYGVENPMKSKEIQDKAHDTLMEKYGVENISQSAEFQDKKKETWLKKYGVDHPMRLTEFQEKTKQTWLEHYGADNPMQIDSIKQKQQNTLLAHYGVENPSQSLEIQDRKKQTNLDKYGVEWTTQSLEVRNKAVQTNLERYGCKAPTQCKEISTKMRKTQLSHLNEKQIQDWILATSSPEMFQKIALENNLNSVMDLSAYFGISTAPIHKIIKNFNLGSVYYHSESSLETEIKHFLDEIHVEYEKTRRIIAPLELDIYCPKYNIAIEMNGTYWHSSFYKDKNYHFDKSRACEQQGIRLIHIYEYEWKNPQTQAIIKSILKSAFGCNQNTKIFARNCIVKALTNSEAKEFINTNHIQGYHNAKITYGLFYHEELIQIMSFTYIKRFNWWEIVRECTKKGYTVVDGISKLFKFFIDTYAPNQVFGYCDFNKFDGYEYSMLGMHFMGYTDLDEKWLMDDGTVENQKSVKPSILKEHSIAQIWGSGSKKYLWTKN